jgi:hypothetical protein
VKGRGRRRRSESERKIVFVDEKSWKDHFVDVIASVVKQNSTFLFF